MYLFYDNKQNEKRKTNRNRLKLKVSATWNYYESLVPLVIRLDILYPLKKRLILNIPEGDNSFKYFFVGALASGRGLH